jgi:hypothetical protein
MWHTSNNHYIGRHLTKQAKKNSSERNNFQLGCPRLLDNLTVSQLLKKFPAFYGTITIITVFTKALHYSLPSPTPIQSTLFHFIQCLF